MPLQRLRHAIEQNRPLPQLPLCGLWHTSHWPGTPLGCRLTRLSLLSLGAGAGGDGRRVGAGRGACRGLSGMSWLLVVLLLRLEAPVRT